MQRHQKKVVVFTLKIVLTSIQYLLFLTLQGKEKNFRGHKLTQNKVQKKKIRKRELYMRRVIFFFFSPNEQRAGGGGGAARLFLFLFFPCSADHERDWPPCKVVFFGLATNALNVRNNNNNNV